MISEGQIGIPEIQKAFVSLTGAGGRFENMMAKQSETLGGLWSTLKDNISLTAMRIAEMVSNAFNFKGIMKGLISFTGYIREELETGQRMFARFAGYIRTATAPVFQWLSQNGKTSNECFGNLPCSFRMVLRDQGGTPIVCILKYRCIHRTVNRNWFRWPRDRRPHARVNQGYSILVGILHHGTMDNEFSFRNWKQIGESSLASTEYRIVSAANVIIHWFGKQVLSTSDGF